MSYKNIIFDIGKVLLGYDWLTMLRNHGLTEEEAYTFAGYIFPDPLWRELDIGRMSDEEIVTGYGEKYPQYKELSRWFFDNADQMPVPRPRVWAMARKLKEAGYGIYLLSNYNKGLLEKHTKGTPVLDLADGGVISYQIHEIKPYPPIYQELFRRYSLDPSECIFFDDREENVEGSKAVGMDAVQVLSEEQLLEELEKLYEAAGK